MHFQCPECDKEGKTESELRKNGCKCKIQSLQMLDTEDHEDANQKKTSENKNSKKKSLKDDNRSEQKKII